MLALNIYKPTQGKVARLMTAAGCAILILGAALWLADEVRGQFGSYVDVRTQYGELAADYTPHEDGKTLIVGNAAAMQIKDALAEQLAELKENPETRNRPSLEILAKGRARPKTINITGVDVEKGTLSLWKPLDASFQKGAGLQSFHGSNYLVYIQSGAVLGFVIISAAILYWVLNRPNIVDFLIHTESEMRKVNWPTRREVVGSTWVVIGGTLMMAALLWVIDLVFVAVFSSVNILEVPSPLIGFVKWLFGAGE